MSRPQPKHNWLYWRRHRSRAKIAAWPITSSRIAADPNTDTALPARVYGDLLPYLYPTRKALEMSGPDGGAIKIDDGQMHEQVMRKLFGHGYAENGATRTLT